MSNSRSASDLPSHEITTVDNDPSAQMSLKELIEAYSNEFKYVQSLEELGRTIHGLHEHLDPDVGIESARALIRIATAYLERSQRAQSVEDRKASALLLLEASNALPDDQEDKNWIYQCSSTEYFALFGHDQPMEDLMRLYRRIRTVSRRLKEPEHSRTPCMTELDAYIRELESADTLDSETLSAKAMRNLFIAYSWQLKYEATGEISNLKASIAYMESTLKIAPRDDPCRIDGQRALGEEYLALYLHTHDQQILENCIALYDDVLRVIPEKDPVRWKPLLMQGLSHIAQYDAIDDVASLRVGALQLKDSISRIPLHISLRTDILPFIAKTWHRLYKATANEDSLVTLKEYLFELLHSLPEVFAIRREILLILTDLVFDEIFKFPQVRVIVRAAVLHAHVLARMPRNDPKRSDIDRRLFAFIWMESCLQGTSHESDPVKLAPEIYSRTGLCLDLPTIDDRLLQFYQRFGTYFQLSSGKDSKQGMEDLMTLTKEWQNDLPETSSDRLDEQLRQQILSMRASSYEHMFRETNSMDHLEQAITCFNQERDIILRATSPSPSNSAMIVSALADRYKATGSEQDLDDLIKNARQLVNPSEGVSDRHGLLLAHSTLGKQLSDRYERTGNEDDLDQSIEHFRQLLLLYDTDDGHHPTSDQTGGEVDHGRFDLSLNSLDAQHLRGLIGIGWGFHLRAKRGGSRSHRAEALKYLEKAVDVSPKEDRRACQVKLGEALYDQPNSTPNVEEIDKGFSIFCQLLVHTEDDEEKAEIIIHMLDAIAIRFRYTKEKFDFQVAMEMYRILGKIQAKPNPRSKSIAIRRVFMLGLIAIKANVQVEEYIGSYEKFFGMIEQLCVPSAVTPGHETTSLTIGTAYYAAYQRTKQADYLEKARRFFEPAFDCSERSPRIRMDLGRELFNVYATLEEWSLAYRMAATTLSLVPIVTTRGLETCDRQEFSVDFTGFASDATAVAIQARQSPSTALKLLEAGRGFVVGSLLGLRSDTDDLQKQYPELAKRYLKYRDQIDSITSVPSSPAAAWLPVHQKDFRYKANQELERVIAEIQALPGFDSFLREPSEEAMKAAAASGPIVVINISQYRCDALIVKPEGISIQSLPQVTVNGIKSMSREVKKAGALGSMILEQLWDQITRPVLEKLGITTRPSKGSHWPQICWIPTGPLVGFPLHAAGYHQRCSGETVIDLAISSYGVSVATLLHGHTYRQKPEANRKPEHAVMVGMPGLANAVKEVTQLAQTCQSLTVQTPERNAEDVLEALKDCDIFHFAGHGLSNHLDPSQSALVLEGKPLTVSNLLDVNLNKRRPFLAFLSACSTGQIKHDKYMDEGLHLIAACQVAGFQHVIGTLWEVSDDLCVKAAVMVYEWMQEKAMSHNSVGQALHRATKKLRNKWVEDNDSLRRQRRESSITCANPAGVLRDIEPIEEAPLLWVPYVHYGL